MISAIPRSLSAVPRRTFPNKVSSHFIARLLNMSSIPHRDLYFLPLPAAACCAQRSSPPAVV